MLGPWKKSYDQLGQNIKKYRHYFANKVPSSQSYGFPSSHVWMWELDYKKKAESQRIDAFELWCWRRLLRVHGLKEEIQPVHPKGNQSWMFIGRTDTKAETLILWPPDAKNWLWKRPWCCERSKARREGDDRGWDGWMASPTQWTWVWVNSRSWW